MIYFSPTFAVIKEKYRQEFGYLVSYRQKIPKWMRGRPWLIDNGVFTGRFVLSAWVKLMEKFTPYKESCVGVVAPDAVGDWLETKRLFQVYAPVIRELGYPVAFATQDGLPYSRAPWDELDCLFIGGSDSHKREVARWITGAQRRGKWVHVGRVNSPKRMWEFESADSVDGTTITREPERQELLVKAMREIQARKRSKQLWDT